MKRPRIGVLAHRRELESVLGVHPAVVVAEAYLQHLDRAGGDPVILWPGMRRAPLDLLDGVLMIGGGDVAPDLFGSVEPGEGVDVGRDTLESAVVTACRDQRTPLLGMCRGAQILNVALGGTLQRVPGHRQHQPLGEAAHEVEILAGSTLSELAGEVKLEVNSYHVWAVDRPGTGLRVVATSPDGVPEAVETEDRDWWCLGLQWHAELLAADHGSWPFAWLVDAARR